MVGRSLAWTINGVDRELVGGISVFVIILREELTTELHGGSEEKEHHAEARRTRREKILVI
jgi:hypothetical protein